MKRHDLSYWEDLAERYFQAETSEKEEAQLRKFLCTEAASDPRFDEIRATLSFLHVSRPPRRPHVIRHPLGIVAVAACLCVAAFLGWYQYRQYNISSVRVAGERTETDAALVMQQQMTEMFNPINQ